jgi:hypothetical protein
MGCSVGTRMSSVAQVRRPRERDGPQTAGRGSRAGPIRADLEPRRIAGRARSGSTDRACKITAAVLRLEMPHERAKAHHIAQLDDGRDWCSAFLALFVHGSVWTRAGFVRPGQIGKRFCERRHQADLTSKRSGLCPVRTSRSPSEPVAREILVRSRTARPKRCIRWR